MGVRGAIMELVASRAWVWHADGSLESYGQDAPHRCAGCAEDCHRCAPESAAESRPVQQPHGARMLDSATRIDAHAGITAYPAGRRRPGLCQSQPCRPISVSNGASADDGSTRGPAPDPLVIEGVTGGAERPSNPSDEALIAGMVLGDELAAVTFVRRYQKRVFGLAIGMLGDPAAAEDVAQEALIRAWRHAPMFDARRGSASTWILTITRNLAIDAIRKHRAVPTDPDDLIAIGMASQGRSIEDLGAGGVLAPELRAALNGLPAGQRRAIVLAALYGRTIDEISSSESIPLGTAKTRIRSGLRKLRVALHDSEEWK